MKKIFTAIATVIVTRFIMKVIDRVKNPPVPTREELHEEVLRKSVNMNNGDRSTN